MDEVKLYIGLDVHKDSIAIASARTLVMIPNSLAPPATVLFP
ncbi:hypothetical protein [Burkholderia cepacia]|nr:hypothetical protein [Burkholderia cepacia]